ncbi:MAG: dephospho-CoA kinase [Muribaculaceae bacterium]|nr:dephospho-CoA kinase [Muribaculaceae bacterium]
MKQLNNTIGITGGIGAGKSVVSRVLRCNGFVVYDCDYEAKAIMRNNLGVKLSLIEKLGNDIYSKDGELNRGRLAQMLFSNDNVRTFVNSVVHQAVREDIENRRKNIRGDFFIESAIIVTGGIATFCNQIWIVTAPLRERLERVMKRDKTSLEAVQKRIDAQQHELSLLDSNKTVMLENDNKTPLLSQILKMTDKLIQQQIYSISC